MSHKEKATYNFLYFVAAPLIALYMCASWFICICFITGIPFTIPLFVFIRCLPAASLLTGAIIWFAVINPVWQIISELRE